MVRFINSCCDQPWCALEIDDGKVIKLLGKGVFNLSKSLSQLVDWAFFFSCTCIVLYQAALRSTALKFYYPLFCFELSQERANSRGQPLEMIWCLQAQPSAPISSVGLRFVNYLISILSFKIQRSRWWLYTFKSARFIWMNSTKGPTGTGVKE